MIITTTEYDYKREDGVFVISIGCLKDQTFLILKLLSVLLICFQYLYMSRVLCCQRRKTAKFIKNATNEDVKQDLIKKETISYYLENIIEKGGDTKNIYLETSLVKKII